MLDGFFRSAKFLLEEISKPLRYNSRDFSAREPYLITGSRCGTACVLRCTPRRTPRFPYEAKSQFPESRPPQARRAVRKRRVSSVAVRPGEGPLTERTAATQSWRRERVFMPPEPPFSATRDPPWSGGDSSSQSPVKTYPTHTVLTQFRSSLQTRLLNHRGRAPFGNDVSSR